MSNEDARLKQRPIRQLIARLIAQVRHLLHYEFLLARSELRPKMRSFAFAGLSLGAALGCAALGGLGLFVTAVALLAIVLPLWAAALVVMGGFFMLAAVFALAAKSFIAGVAPLLPERTIASIQEDLSRLKGRTRSSHG